MNKQFKPDISSILYLALARKSHSNLYRFTMTMNETVDPTLLQQAVNRIQERFSMFFCGFQPHWFADVQTVCEQPVSIIEDTQVLKVLSKDEIRQCAARILYAQNRISIEFFHALTDGYGAIAYLSTLTAEYLRLRYHLEIPGGYPVLDLLQVNDEEEVRDEYLHHASKKSMKLKKVFAYQMPRENKKDSTVRVAETAFSLSDLKAVSSHHGVSPTAFLSALMAEVIMKRQGKQNKKMKPVRIMIPVNLRGFFPSRTLRNFIETIHVTLRHDELDKSLKERAQCFRMEMKQQLSAEHLASMVKTHADAQTSPFFAMIPRSIKYAAFKVGYAFFGESNSSLTFTNLGNVHLPEVMHPYVKKIDCYLSPRAGSPYNCAMIAYRDQVSLNFSSFNQNSELEKDFFAYLHKMITTAELSS